MKLQIELGIAESGDPLLLDLDRLMTSKMLVQARSGGGKSYLLRRIVEQCWGKAHVIVIDPEGEFVSLREKFDIVVAGAEGDVPLSPQSAARLAELVMKNHVNIVCDVSEMTPDDRCLWVKNFFEALLRTPKDQYHNTLVAVDEAHLFAPESGHGSSVSLPAFRDLMARGRKRGLCPILATQRLGKLNKSVAAEALNILIGGTTVDVDRERAAETFGISRAGKSAFFTTLRGFDPGEFVAMGPAFPSSDPYRFKSGPVQTSHSQAMGGFKKASARRVADEFAAFLKELQEAPEAPAEASPDKDLVQSLRNRIQALEKEKSETQARELLLNGELRKAKELLASISNLLKPVSEVEKLAPCPSPPEPAMQVSKSEKPAPSPGSVTVRVPSSSPFITGDFKPGKCHKLILGALAQYPDGCDLQCLAVSSTYMVSGSFKNCLSELRTIGIIEGENSALIKLSDKGRELWRHSTIVVPIGEDLWNYWLNHFGKCHRAIMTTLRRGRTMSINDLAVESHYEISGSFKNCLSELRTAGIIDGKNLSLIFFTPTICRAIGH